MKILEIVGAVAVYIDHMSFLNLKKDKGISLISLIITIIVIIILAAIVIYTGLNTPDRANFAKFTQQVDNIQTAINEEYFKKVEKYATEHKTRTESQIYYIIASGKEDDVDVNTTLENVRTGTVEELGLYLRPDTFQGTEFYEIDNNISIAGMKDNKGLYAALGTEEKHYVTDKGEFFILPGYPVENGNTTRWYVNASKYYEGEKKILASEITIKSIKIVDSLGNEPLKESIEPSTKLYASIDIIAPNTSMKYTVNNDSTEYEIDHKYEITQNGEYEFKFKIDDLKYIVKKIIVDKYNEMTLEKKNIKVGDYIYYKPDNAGTMVYSTSEDYVGYNNSVKTKTGDIKWIVWEINGDEIVITPTEEADTGLTLMNVQGFVNGPKAVNEACKLLFQNNSLGYIVDEDKIRSIKIEDLEKVYGKEEGLPLYKGNKSQTNTYNAQYYLDGTSEPTIINQYTNQKHKNSTTFFQNYGYRRFFYAKDENGNTLFDSNHKALGEITGVNDNTPKKLKLGTEYEMEYIEMTSSNPILVKNTMKTVSTTDTNWLKNSEGKRFIDLIKNYDGWTSSSHIAVYYNNDNNYVNFGLQRLRPDDVDASNVYFSDGRIYESTNALRPMIKLNIKTMVIDGNGKSSSPYRIK